MEASPLKPNIFPKGEPTVQCGNFARSRDWMDFFLDFHISKLEERCVEIRKATDGKLPDINREPVWN
jgi:hypothetical protein